VPVSPFAGAGRPETRATLIGWALWLPVARQTPAEASLDAPAFNALDEAAGAIAGLLDFEDALQLIVERVRILVGARYAALGIVGPDDRIQRFITSGMTRHQREEIGPPPRGRGLLGLIIRKARSYRIPNIAAHADSYGFPANHLPMTSFLGFPHVAGSIVRQLLPDG
jgi:GAF domain-containing protein